MRRKLGYLDVFSEINLVSDQESMCFKLSQQWFYIKRIKGEKFSLDPLRTIF